MCGICGYISKENIDRVALESMTDRLKHRGPDDKGVWFANNILGYNIGLGHRRLAVIDCTHAGHQPMTDSSGRYHIVFNGEIYNYRELRQKCGYNSYTSDSDTEVLLNTFIRYGKKCLDLLNGMFAFAVYDSQENALFIARDRMGEKPLYYFKDGDHFAFASELKSIIDYPLFVKSINRDVLVQFFAQNCILPPNTIFENTYKLGAGEYLIWKDGIVTIGKYYSPIDEYFNGLRYKKSDYKTYKKELKELLYDSIDKRLVADVPVGTFLSGGIDSTLVTAIAADIRCDKGIDTFSIGFEDSEYDESQSAAQSAKMLRTRHHEKIMSEEDFFEMLSDLTTYYDEPFSDSSQLPTMLVSRFARESVTVALSGDGGDELFAGYSNIDTINKLKKLDWILTPARSIIPSWMSGRFPKDSVRVLLEKKQGLEKIQYYAKIRENLAKQIILQNETRGVIDLPEIEHVQDWLQKRMLLDMTTYLPDEIMTKTDRASMRFALELRCPILDHRIVNYSMRVPIEYKYRRGIKKYILKDILYEFLPEEMMNRPKKGFGAPIYKWMTNELYSELKEYLEAGFIYEQGLFNYKRIRSFYERFRTRNEESLTQVMWSYFVFQRWWNEYMER